jgi:hypothetical protein
MDRGGNAEIVIYKPIAELQTEKFALGVVNHRC